MDVLSTPTFYTRIRAKLSVLCEIICIVLVLLLEKFYRSKNTEIIFHTPHTDARPWLDFGYEQAEIQNRPVFDHWDLHCKRTMCWVRLEVLEAASGSCIYVVDSSFNMYLTWNELLSASKASLIFNFSWEFSTFDISLLIHYADGLWKSRWRLPGPDFRLSGNAISWSRNWQ